MSIGYFASCAPLSATYFVRYSFFTPAFVPVSYLSDLVVIGSANLVWFAFHSPSNEFTRAARVVGRSVSVLAVASYFARCSCEQRRGACHRPAVSNNRCGAPDRGSPYIEHRDYAHQFGLVFWWLLIAATVDARGKT